MSGEAVSVGSVGFFRSTVESSAVCWSKDQRIALAAADAVFVLTLKRPTISEVKTLKEESPSISIPPSSSQNGYPYVAITVATAPQRDALAPPKVGARGSNDKSGPKAGLDLASTDKSGSVDGTKAIAWSPVGCSPSRGCVLTMVTLSGRLLLYLSPGCTGLSWQLVDLSPLTARLFQCDPIPSSSTEQMECQGNKPPEDMQGNKMSKAKEKKGKRSAKGSGSGGARDHSNGDEDNSLEISRPKRARVSSPSYQNLPGTGLAGHQVGVAFSACAWLPTLLLISREGGSVAMAGVIAVATKLGQVALFGVKLPVESEGLQEDQLFLLARHDLPINSGTDAASVACCSSLLWLPSSTPPIAPPTPTPTSVPQLPPTYISMATDSPAHCSLVVGCTNGQVYRLKLQWEGLAADAKGVGDLAADVAVVGCAGGLEQTVVTVIDTIPIWAKADAIPVYCLASYCRFSKDSLWVAFSKSSAVMATRLNSSYDQVGSQLQVGGIHKMPVSEVGALSPTSFVSSSLDGTIQTFSVDTCHTSVTPSAVGMEMEGEGVACRGLGVSENCIMIAAAMNCGYLPDVRKGHVVPERARLILKAVASKEDVEELLKSHPSGKWDVCEYLRRHYLEHRTMFPPIKDLWSVLTKKHSVPFHKLQLLLHANIVMGKKAESERCRGEIIRKHVVRSLRKWGIMEKKLEGPAGKKKHEKVVEQKKERDKETDNAVSLQIMAGWLQSVATHVCITDARLSEKILEEFSKSGKLDGEEALSLETCPACSDPVPLTNHDHDLCGRGHRWGRCGLTMLLAADSRCYCCLQCGGVSNNVATVNAKEGSWLKELLVQHSCCVFCGGYLQQVL